MDTLTQGWEREWQCGTPDWRLSATLMRGPAVLRLLERAHEQYLLAPRRLDSDEYLVTEPVDLLQTERVERFLREGAIRLRADASGRLELNLSACGTAPHDTSCERMRVVRIGAGTLSLLGEAVVFAPAALA